MNSFDKFLYPLPSHEKIYDTLKNENISIDDYNFAKIVRNKYCSNIGNCHNLYLKSDVLILADVFKNFRRMCLSEFELETAWYYTSSGLSWDAMLKRQK